jgi:UDP-N-acetyl-D-glucosamine dehydrogenase
MDLKEKILQRKAVAGVIGLGYVGLPLALEFCKAGFQVIGFDVNINRVNAINQGGSYIQDVSPEAVQAAVQQKRLLASTDFSLLKEIDAVSICVPTPLRKTKDPDISYIVAAVDQITRYLHKGQLIVLESTTYPGTTDEVILPELSKTGLKVGEDFYLAFSPERVDPGNTRFTTRNIPKVIGGITPRCTEMAMTLYQQIIEKVIPVSSTKTAEMVKLLENTFRSVNIALVNEIALMCDKLGIDVWEVINAAATKPFGFMPFYPGPGLGGHCIPLDPFYLAWKLKTLNYTARFIELAGEINAFMPNYVISKVAGVLNDKERSVKNSKILIIGVAYKNDVNYIRESPALDIIRLLEKQGAKVYYHDPYIPEITEEGITLKAVNLTESLLAEMDCTVIVTDHSAYDYQWLVDHSNIVIDTRNATKNVRDSGQVIRKL